MSVNSAYPLSQNSYKPQLDSLRAIAVLGVIWHHWFPEYTFGLPVAAGVQLFFVLSGFLISDILLAARQRLEQQPGENPRIVICHFYARRILRIVPLYYLVLLCCVWGNIADLRQSFPWHFAYCSNFYFVLQQGWHRSVAHFWTLSVEEQFYLFWPFLVLFAPRRRLMGWFIACAILAAIYRAAGVFLFPEIQLFAIGTLGSLDSLAFGAGLALAIRNPTALTDRLRANKKLITLSALIGCFVTFLLPQDVAAMLSQVFGRTLLSIVFCVVVDACVKGVRGLPARILDFAALRYIGKISYGLYLIHNLAWFPARLVANKYPALVSLPYWDVWSKAVLTLFLASASWHFFEKPIGLLKNRFP